MGTPITFTCCALLSRLMYWAHFAPRFRVLVVVNRPCPDTQLASCFYLFCDVIPPYIDAGLVEIQQNVTFATRSARSGRDNSTDKQDDMLATKTILKFTCQAGVRQVDVGNFKLLFGCDFGQNTTVLVDLLLIQLRPLTTQYTRSQIYSRLTGHFTHAKKDKDSTYVCKYVRANSPSRSLAWVAAGGRTGWSGSWPQCSEGS